MPWYTCVVKINHKQLLSYFSKITFNFKITVKNKTKQRPFKRARVVQGAKAGAVAPPGVYLCTQQGSGESAL